jgi:hypothetical protein
MTRKSVLSVMTILCAAAIASADVQLDWPGLTTGGVGLGEKTGYGGNWAVELLFDYTGGDYIYAPGGTLTTFCIEWNESFVFAGDPGLVGTLADGAVNGGINGPNPDPLDAETAWLYDQYLDGNDFGYTDPNARAAAVQDAIWALEGEATGTGGTTPYKASHATLITQAANAVAGGWTNTNIKVLNMVGADGKIRQDVLARVPEPAAGLLGLLGIGLVTRMKRLLS